MRGCDLPPKGWRCFLEEGHDGPCPTWPVDSPERNLFRRFDWLKIAHVGMFAGMMFFFVSLGIVTLKTAPVVHHTDAMVTDANRVVLSIGGTAAQVRKASEIETKQLTDVTVKANSDLDELHADLVELHTVLVSANRAVNSANSTIQTTNKQIAKIGPVLDKTGAAVDATRKGIVPVLDNLNTTASGASKIVNDPNIPKTMANVQTMTSNGAVITTHLMKTVTAVKSKLKAAALGIVRVASWFVKF